MIIQAQIKRVYNSRFIARADNGRAYVIDSSDKACSTSPMQMLLMNIAGCSSIEVSEIFIQKRIKLSEFEVNIVGEEALEHPKISELEQPRKR